MIDTSRIKWQRAFKIPKSKLDLFLVKITMSQHDFGYYSMEYTFDAGERYDVIVNGYGDPYPYYGNEIEKFAKELNEKGQDLEVDWDVFAKNEQEATIEKLQSIVAVMKDTLEKIEDPRKRDHKEPDTYTELGCVMHMATKALETVKELEDNA